MAMSQGHTSSPLFLQSAEELAARLEQGGQPELAREARRLAGIFRSWLTTRPSDDVRVTTIRALFDLNRKALEVLSGGRG